MCPTLRPCGLLPARFPCSWDSLGKNTGVGCHFLLQRIFPTQGLKPGILYCRQILYHLSNQRRLMDLYKRQGPQSLTLRRHRRALCPRNWLTQRACPPVPTAPGLLISTGSKETSRSSEGRCGPIRACGQLPFTTTTRHMHKFSVSRKKVKSN